MYSLGSSIGLNRASHSPLSFEGEKEKKKKKKKTSLIRKPAADQLYILTSTLADHRRAPVKEYSELHLFDLHAIRSIRNRPKTVISTKNHTQKKVGCKVARCDSF